MTAKGFNIMLSPLQIGRDTSATFHGHQNGEWASLTLPDITIWTSGTEHHEIKHKNPTRDNRIGLEQYRFDALVLFNQETQHDVMYTIHNHDLSGGPESKTNSLDHWVTAPVTRLMGSEILIRRGYSWVRGAKKLVPIIYWDYALWEPLSEWMDRKYTRQHVMGEHWHE
jgi:hypothetical protein